MQGFVKDLLPGDQPRGWRDRGKGIPGTAEQKVASTLLHRGAQKLSSVETFQLRHWLRATWWESGWLRVLPTPLWGS